MTGKDRNYCQRKVDRPRYYEMSFDVILCPAFQPSNAVFFLSREVLIISDRDLISYDNHRRVTEHSHTCM